MFSHRSGAVRTAFAGLAVVLLTTAGCTAADDPPSSSGPTPSPLPDRSVGASPTIEPKPVAMDVTVSRTAGRRVKKGQQRSVERQVGRVLARYFDGAYLGGDYPRRAHPEAFAVFTEGAARSARRDRALLTNAATGSTIERVVPVRKQAALDLFVPGKVAGATARIRLVFVAERSKGADQRVVVTGRLLLTRAPSGAWKVFGYDVQRSAAVAKGGS